MSPKTDFVSYILYDAMAGIGSITARAMFGGHGLYKDGVIFGLIADDQLYFKTGESNQKYFEAAGSQPFTYEAKNKKRVAMSYWEVPSDVLENRDEIQLWINKAVKASLKAKKGK